MTIKYNICEKRHEKKMTQKQLAMKQVLVQLWLAL